MTSLVLLQEIDAWLSFNNSPSKEQISELRNDIKKHISEQLNILHVVGRSEQLVCDCGDSNMTWYGNDDDKQWFCFNCKKEVN
ncbi:MAG: hypothetical protein KBH21_00190 [Acetoanaerobium sp.]|nr:hypothetical protein [Acetoanaerobium sp.]